MTKIADLLAAGRTFSFEFFPPKSDEESLTLAQTLRDLEPLEPSFVSVTYRGGRASRQRTYDLVTTMAATTALTPMAHLVCTAHSRQELVEILEAYRTAGIENLMALGGDPPTDPDDGPGELRHAIELVTLAREVGEFSIGVAAHPAGHPASPSLEADREWLVDKMARADFAITQFFFEIHEYQGLVADLAARGMHKAVLPGIMPVTSLRSIPKMATMGAAVPPWMVARLSAAEEAGGEDAVRAAGVEIATDLCRRLLEAGAPGLHFYTLNRSGATRQIYESLGVGPRGTSPARPA